MTVAAVGLSKKALFPITNVNMLRYAFIWIKVWKGESTCESQQNQELILKSKINAIQMLVIVVLMLLCSWFPHFIFTGIELGDSYHEKGFEDFVKKCLHQLGIALCACNRCINPVFVCYTHNKISTRLQGCSCQKEVMFSL
ncbi:hypothetical protein AVEN_10180-1 [Araneus ventricosus]|uniref:G-protein coupled receptors family 1 profile domain-containing protein n=1 Tax=Araneus ventricosus TaxID=182803 RepID=A0A4Y2R7I2_ARAVE|nr:hypothetical protein AVEN_10180-1 [Araneus ventricosus]